MKVILLKSVPKVGKKDAVVEVAPGYAHHALLPQKLAIAATPSALQKLKRQTQNKAVGIEVRHNLLDKSIEALKAQELTMNVKANAQGNLFSKISAADVGEYLMKEYRIAIDPKLLVLPDGAIKRLGTYVITIADNDYTATFTLVIA